MESSAEPSTLPVSGPPPHPALLRTSGVSWLDARSLLKGLILATEEARERPTVVTGHQRALVSQFPGLEWPRASGGSWANTGLQGSPSPTHASAAQPGCADPRQDGHLPPASAPPACTRPSEGTRSWSARPTASVSRCPNLTLKGSSPCSSAFGRSRALGASTVVASGGWLVTSGGWPAGHLNCAPSLAYKPQAKATKPCSNRRHLAAGPDTGSLDGPRG